MQLESFSDWLSSTDANAFIQSRLWVVPTVQSIHIIALSILVASAALLHMRLAGLAARSRPLRQLAGRYLAPIGWALAALAATGAILVTGEPERELGSGLFWIKMSLIALVSLLTIAIVRFLPAGSFEMQPAGARSLMRFANLSAILLWASIVICGRWIAYAL